MKSIASVSGTVVTFYSGDFVDMKLDIAYNLGPGEALAYVGEI